MKKIKLLFIPMILFSFALISCNSEDKATSSTENLKTVEFSKTTAMLNFEDSLREWFRSKRENVTGTDKAAISTKITEDAKTLLNSIGKTDIASKANQSTDELVRNAMKAYSEKLTEMYNEQIR